MKKRTATPAKISNAWISPSADRRHRRDALVLALGRHEQLEAADHLRERRVLDDVHEQADERRQQAAERLRQDHEAGAGRPSRSRARPPPRAARTGSTAPRRGVASATWALPQRTSAIAAAVRAARELGVAGCDRRQAEVDEEDGDEDRQAAEDLDVEPDQRPERPEADRQQRPEHDSDQRAADDRDRRDAQRPREPLRRGCSARPARPSRASRSLLRKREPALEEADHGRQRPDEREVDDASTVIASFVSSVRLLMLIAVVVSSM